MNRLIYEPQPNATPDEVMQVLKVFTVATMPAFYQTNKLLMDVYEALPPEAKRHFKIKETK